MRACHAAGPGSIPGRDKFPGWGIFEVFPHLQDKCQEALGSQAPRISFGRHHLHQSSLITGANDLRCWRALKLQMNKILDRFLSFRILDRPTCIKPVRVAQGVEAWPDSTRLVHRIAGSNPASGMDVCVRLCVCVIWNRKQTVKTEKYLTKKRRDQQKKKILWTKRVESGHASIPWATRTGSSG